MSTVRQQISTAARAAKHLGGISGAVRNAALESIATALERRRGEIVSANEEDLAQADRDGLSAPLLKRLRFDDSKIDGSIVGVRSVAGLPDPVGKTILRRELDEGLILTKRTSPIGVIAMVFESRPDALVQIASLALKSGNAVILKGGSEAKASNRILADTIAAATATAGIPEGWIQLIETREDVAELLRQDGEVDLIIPRGSNEFVRYIMDNTTIPVLGHADGVCHVYIDESADPTIAVTVSVDSKTQYVAVCNAAETLLIHESVAKEQLPAIAAALREYNVEIRGCPRTREILSWVESADESDWRAEYLDYTIAIRVVGSIDTAITHINTYGSGHTDAIVTGDENAAERFITNVDSASVMWNVSTRFADGYRYGLGAEVGISTGKIHARGPVGVEGLVSSKWILQGHGHTVAPYASGERAFHHRDLSIE